METRSMSAAVQTRSKRALPKRRRVMLWEAARAVSKGIGR
jgi:hypothetical protein